MFSDLPTPQVSLSLQGSFFLALAGVHRLFHSPGRSAFRAYSGRPSTAPLGYAISSAWYALVAVTASIIVAVPRVLLAAPCPA